MTKASDLKRSDVIAANGGLFVIRQIDVQSPSARGAATLYRIKAQAVTGSGKYEERFKGDDDVETVLMQRRQVQFSYTDSEECIFMDSESFAQYPIRQSDIEDEMTFITEATEGVQVLLVDDTVIGIELPQTVMLTIVDTTPAMKAASASARTKPATLNTGLVVSVPEYIEVGEKVKVNTGERAYISRA